MEDVEICYKEIVSFLAVGIQYFCFYFPVNEFISFD